MFQIAIFAVSDREGGDIRLEFKRESDKVHSRGVKIFIQFILLCLAGWINWEQQAVIEYLREEVRVLKEIQGKSGLSRLGGDWLADSEDF